MSAPPEINNRGGFEDLFKADSPYESDEYRRQVLREQQFYSNRVGEKYEGEQFGPKYQRPTTSGDLLHFIPSEQIKLLKDLQSNREVKPIFLKQVLMDTTRHPNFSPETQIRDTTAESQSGTQDSQTIARKRRTLNVKYLHTMGLNVKFDAPLGQRTGGSFQTATTGVRAGVGQSEMGIISGTGLITTKPAPVALGKGSLLQGHVRMEPIMITRGGNLLDFKQQIISGKGVSIQETSRFFQP
ncbi:hypothetical protein HDU84_001555 [Entophlyctis sp. JEL0112]|nr:hypothetical protein HDU84_001555 [Entophlyctis sp. JEL0112]